MTAPDPMLASEDPPEATLTHHELIAFAEELRASANNLYDTFTSFRYSSAIDEDYKLAWQPLITREYFIELTRLMRAVESHVNSTESPFD